MASLMKTSDSEIQSSPPGEHGIIRKLVKTRCALEEEAPGKFVRKCERTEEVLKECVGRPTERVEYWREYSETDVTDDMVGGYEVNKGD